MKIEKRLQELGYSLPPAPKALAAYVPALISGSHLYVSGQLPLRDGKLILEGTLGKDLSVDDVKECAIQCVLNAFSAAIQVLGDSERIRRVIKLGGFVQSTPEFHDHPLVINGASEFLLAVLGENGQHARAALGVASLPLNAPVEIEFIFEVQ